MWSKCWFSLVTALDDWWCWIGSWYHVECVHPDSIVQNISWGTNVWFPTKNNVITYILIGNSNPHCITFSLNLGHAFGLLHTSKIFKEMNVAAPKPLVLPGGVTRLCTKTKRSSDKIRSGLQSKSKVHSPLSLHWLVSFSSKLLNPYQVINHGWERP